MRKLFIALLLLSPACTTTVVTSSGHDAGRDLNDAGQEQECTLTHDSKGIMWVCEAGTD